MRQPSNDLQIFINAMAELTERERDLLIRRFAMSQTMQEVGKSYRVSNERIRQIEETAIQKIEHLFSERVKKEKPPTEPTEPATGTDTETHTTTGPNLNVPPTFR